MGGAWKLVVGCMPTAYQDTALIDKSAVNLRASLQSFKTQKAFSFRNNAVQEGFQLIYGDAIERASISNHEPLGVQDGLLRAHYSHGVQTVAEVKQIKLRSTTRA